MRVQTVKEQEAEPPGRSSHTPEAVVSSPIRKGEKLRADIESAVADLGRKLIEAIQTQARRQLSEQAPINITSKRIAVTLQTLVTAGDTQAWRNGHPAETLEVQCFRGTPGDVELAVSYIQKELFRRVSDRVELQAQEHPSINGSGFRFAVELQADILT